jgi:hypothetical protein
MGGAAWRVTVAGVVLAAALPVAAPLWARPPAPSLDELERRAAAYFLEQAHPVTGLVKDRARNQGPADDYTVASVAATGFGLAALAVAAERGWVPADEAQARAVRTLRSFVGGGPVQVEGKAGLYYHFVDWATGRRVWESEVSSIDTALLVAGALVVGRYFPGTEVETLAADLYARVDWTWVLTDGGARPDERLIGHGWKPETGFIPYRWDSFSEHAVQCLLAIGSATHPIPAECWAAWRRQEGEYAGLRTFADVPLFCHQFSHCFVYFRGLRDRAGYDYWQAAVNATATNRAFCQDQAGGFRTYREGFWGLSACDGPDGYRAYHAPPGSAEHDGTVAPLAVLAAAPYDPEGVGEMLGRLYARYGDRAWGRYGFCDALNLDRDWFAADVIGIDVGAALLMVENMRSGLVWRLFMSDPAVQRAVAASGLG